MASGNIDGAGDQPEEPPFDPRIEAKLGIPIKNIVAVASGKGGVGKSTVSVNLAVSLAQTGAQVGLLDADIYGPNIPIMMGVDAMPPVVGGKLIPAEAHGVRFMSMGFLLPPEQALIWRGPMLHKAIQQLFSDVDWGALDYLIVDLPPGTGDAQLSLAQIAPLSGGLIVTMPQMVSVADARRGAAAFEQLEVPILGVIENMSGEVFRPRGRRHCGPRTGYGPAGRYRHWTPISARRATEVDRSWWPALRALRHARLASWRRRWWRSCAPCRGAAHRS